MKWEVAPSHTLVKGASRMTPDGGWPGSENQLVYFIGDVYMKKVSHRYDYSLSYRVDTLTRWLPDFLSRS